MGRIVPILWFGVPWLLALLLAIAERAALGRSRRLQAILFGLVTLPFLLPIAFVALLFLYGAGIQAGLLTPLVTTHYFANGETILAQDSRYVLVERLGMEEGAWIGFGGDGVVFGTIELRRRDGSRSAVRLADYLPAEPADWKIQKKCPDLSAKSATSATWVTDDTIRIVIPAILEMRRQEPTARGYHFLYEIGCISAP